MDPLFSKVLVDTTMARPASRTERPPRPRVRHQVRRLLAAGLHRWADRLEVPAPLPVPCR
jgi:hypothetical protein